MKKILLSVGILIVILLLISFFLKESSTKDKTPERVIKIGAILPMTGDFAFFGQEIQRGMNLAVSEARVKNFDIVFEDDQSFKTSAVVNAANKLLNVDKVDVLLNTAVTTTGAISSLLDQKETLGIVVTDSGADIAKMGKYVFGFGYGNALVGRQMADHAYNNLKLKHVSVISAIDNWSEVTSTAFVEEFKKLGGSIDIHEKILVSAEDARSSVTKIKKVNSEALFLPLYSKSLNTAIKQSKELGFSGQLLTLNGFTTDHIKNLGDLSEGIVAAQMYLTNDDFLNKYLKAYGEKTNPSNLALAGLGYDLIRMIEDVTAKMSKEGVEINSKTIRNNLIGLPFNGVMGLTQFTETGISEKPHVILKVEGGKFVRAE